METRPPTAMPAAAAPRWLRRVGWLVALWIASVAALGVLAIVFRGVMGWVGLTG
jgi:hypothetical protein